MDSSARHSFRLFAAACLTFCGLAAMAVGVGLAASPWRVAICSVSLVEPCCSLPGAPARISPLAATPAPSAEAD